MPYGDDITPSGPPPVDGSIAGAPPPGLPWWASSPDMLQQLDASGFTPAQPPAQQPTDQGPAVAPGQLSPGQEAPPPGLPDWIPHAAATHYGFRPIGPPVDSSIAGAPPPGLPDWISPEFANRYGLTPIDSASAPAPLSGSALDPIAHGIREAAHAAGLIVDFPGNAYDAIAKRVQEASPGNQIQGAFGELSKIAGERADEDAATAHDRAEVLKQDAADSARELAAMAELTRASQAREAQLTKNYQDAIDTERNFVVDPNRKWHNLGTGEKIAATIAIALSGIGNAIAGKVDAPNAALKIIDDAIKEDVEQQYKEREDKQWQVGAARNSLDTYRQVAGDAMQAKRLLSAQRKLQVADDVNRVIAEHGGAQAKLLGREVQQRLRLSANQELAAAANARAQREAAKEAAGQKQLNEDAKIGIDQKNANTSSYRAVLEGKNIDFEHQDRQGAMAQQALDRQAARDAALGGKDAPTILDPVTNEPMQNSDGTPLAIKDKDLRDKLGSMLGAGDSVNRLSNQLTAEIREWGGQSDIAKSAKWQKIKADYNDLVFALHGAKGIEGFRPGTAELLHELTGDVDPTSFLRDATAGIQRAKDNVNRDITDSLKRRGGYTGKYSPADTSNFGSDVFTPDDEDLQSVLSSPFRKPQFQAFRDYGLDASTPEAYAESLKSAGISPNDPQHVISSLAAKAPVPPRYAVIIDRLGDTMGGLVQVGEKRVGDKTVPVMGEATPAQQKDAAARLQTITQDAALPAVKAYAAQAFMRAQSVSTRASSDDATDQPDTATAHETVPPVLKRKAK